MAAMLADVLKRWLYESGALSVYHRLRNRDALTVVMYHRVLSPADPRWLSSDPDYTISDALFARTIRFLKRHYNVVAPEQVNAARHGRTRLPPRALLITFDDGWQDSVEYALPILQQEGVPALIFVVANAVGSARPFFQEELIAAWRSERLSPDDWRAIAEATRRAGAHAAPVADLPGLRRLIAALEDLPDGDRDRILDPYATRLDDGLRHMVATSELGRLREGAVAIGLHGRTHTPLTRATDLDDELAESRRIVARHLGVAPDRLVTMSFPHGLWTPEIVERARAQGYELLFTSVPALNRLGPHCADVLGRVGIETDAAQDSHGHFRPEWLALRLFRRPAQRLG